MTFHGLHYLDKRDVDKLEFQLMTEPTGLGFFNSMQKLSGRVGELQTNPSSMWQPHESLVICYRTAETYRALIMDEEPATVISAPELNVRKTSSDLDVALLGHYCDVMSLLAKCQARYLLPILYSDNLIR